MGLWAEGLGLCLEDCQWMNGIWLRLSLGVPLGAFEALPVPSLACLD